MVKFRGGGLVGLNSICNVAKCAKANIRPTSERYKMCKSLHKAYQEIADSREHLYESIESYMACVKHTQFIYICICIHIYTQYIYLYCVQPRRRTESFNRRCMYTTKHACLTKYSPPNIDIIDRYRYSLQIERKRKNHCCITTSIPIIIIIY